MRPGVLMVISVSNHINRGGSEPPKLRGTTSSWKSHVFVPKTKEDAVTPDPSGVSYPYMSCAANRTATRVRRQMR